MASTTAWTPQTPKASAPTYHARSSSIGWRDHFSFHRKRGDSINKSIIEEIEPHSRECISTSFTQSLRQKGSRAFKRANTANDIAVAAAGTDQTSSTPAVEPSHATGGKLAFPQELTRELEKLALARKSRSVDDLTAQARKSKVHDNAKLSKIWEQPPDVPTTVPDQENLQDSPLQAGDISPMSSGITSNTTTDGLTAITTHLREDDSTETNGSDATPLADIGFKAPSPVSSTGSISSTGSDSVDEPAIEQTVDGIDFEMIPPPSAKRTSRKSSTHSISTHSQSHVAASQPTPPVPQLPTFLFVSTPQLSPLSTLPSPATAMFLAPPISGEYSPPRRRWTMQSSARASSVLLPDVYEQPETPFRKAHKRASSENDADTIQICHNGGIITVPSRPPTPPPKISGLPATPAPDVTRNKSTRSAKPSIAPIQVPPPQHDPPVCLPGTLPTPRSKYNPHFPSPQKVSQAPPAPPLPASAGARIAAAAARASATPSRRVSLKSKKPPGRSPPAMPQLVEQVASSYGSAARSSSRSKALKRRSSSSGSEDRRVKERDSKVTQTAVQRSKSQVRKALIKRMALDNIGAPKSSKPSRNTSVSTKALQQHTKQLSGSGIETGAPNTSKPSRNASVSTKGSQQPQTKQSSGFTVERKPVAPTAKLSIPHLETPLHRSPERSPERANKQTNAADQPKATAVTANNSGSTPALLDGPSKELEKITSLTQELKRLEEKCAQARQHQQSLNEARRRLQDVTDSPTRSPASSSSSSNISLQSSASSPRGLALAQLDTKIEKWRSEVEQAEAKRNRIKKKLAWHSVDRLKLIPATKPVLAPDRALPPRPASMFSPSSVYSPDQSAGATLTRPVLMVLAKTDDGSSRSDRTHKVANLKDTPAVENRSNHSQAPSLDHSVYQGPSIDGTIDEHPPTPEQESPPRTAANKPWLGLENFFLSPTAAQTPVPANALSPMSLGASTDRQTIQLFAGEDIMADLAKSAEGIPISPAVDSSRATMIRRLSDTGITDLVTVLQEEIESIGREHRWS